MIKQTISGIPKIKKEGQKLGRIISDKINKNMRYNNGEIISPRFKDKQNRVITLIKEYL